MAKKLPIVVLISGRGSNLQAIIDAIANGLPAEVKAVISNRPEAAGLERAQQSNIPTEVLGHGPFSTRKTYDQALEKLVDRYRPDLVVLAGFMRILTPGFVKHYHGRLINIHPSLLPAFPGLNTHQRALDASVREHGATVHFVTEEVDGGPVIIQARVPVLADDTADVLAARVLEQEHRIYPQVIRWCAQRRLTLQGFQVLLDGRPISTRMTHKAAPDPEDVPQQSTH